METPKARSAGRVTPWVFMVVCAIAVGIPPAALLPLFLGIGLSHPPSATKGDLAQRQDDGTTPAAPCEEQGAGPHRAAARADHADLELRSRSTSDRKPWSHLRVARSAAIIPYVLPPSRAPCA
jgi:hypothetical protein